MGLDGHPDRRARQEKGIDPSATGRAEIGEVWEAIEGRGYGRDR